MALPATHCMLRYIRRSLLVLLGVLMLAGLATPAAASVPDIATAAVTSAGEVGSGESDEDPAKPDLGLSHAGHHLNGAPRTTATSAAFEPLPTVVEVGAPTSDSALRAISLLPPTKPPRA